MTIQTVTTPERTVTRRPATYEQYLAWAGESRVVEWVDGEMIEYMPPLYRHQEVTWFLFSLLRGFVEAGELGLVGAGPFEFRLWPDGPAREPDVFYISRARLQRLTERRFEGAPDVAVEVVSTGSVREDRVRKFNEYEQAGAAEYWLIDPRPYQQAAEFYRRDADGLFQPVEVTDGRYRSAELPGFWLEVGWLWHSPSLPYGRLLAQILGREE